MTRGRRTGVRAEEQGIQDGAGAPLTTCRQAEKQREVAERLAQYALQPVSSSPSPSIIECQAVEERVTAGAVNLLQTIKNGTPSPQTAAVLNANPLARDMGAQDGGSCNIREPTLSDVFGAVKLCSTTLLQLTEQVGSIKAEISFVRHDLQKVTERLTEAEERISSLDDMVAPINRETQRHAQAISLLQAKADDLENRLRRNNVRVIGVPEKTEGQNPSTFFEVWLKNVFGVDNLTPLFAVERAHRVPARPPPPGGPPRPVLIRLLHYKDRDHILRLAREKKDAITEGGKKISFFPDFSSEIQKRRAQFYDVKRRLRAFSTPYSMIYPARLRVVALGKVHFFNSPKEALEWLDEAEGQIRRQSPRSSPREINGNDPT